MGHAILYKRIQLLTQLNDYLISNDDEWQAVKIQSHHANSWFSVAQIEMAINNIATAFLDKDKLEKWIASYPTLATHPNNEQVTLGIVMAGNIPLVGFHDFLCGFIAGFGMKLKLSSKDTILWKHILYKMETWDAALMAHIFIEEVLKNCDAYIATGSNNTSRYFKAYFNKYPHIIRKNRTSVAILTGNESAAALKGLAQDITTFFGLGCRNVSKIFVPTGYDFEPLMTALKAHDDLLMHHKYKNNYDFQLSIFLLNKVPYFTNDVQLFIENTELFAPISTIYYEYYEEDSESELMDILQHSDDVQAIVLEHPKDHCSKCIEMGHTQQPSLMDYADGVDTMAFLSTIVV